jgi:tetratricopeptide (TPR) repeat protein
LRSIVRSVVLLVAACGAATAVADGRSDAALSLLETAKQDLRTGQPEQAAALIERALRIDPSNPALWHYLGEARRELGDTAQADAMAAKSQSLTGADRGLRARTAPAREITPALGGAEPRATDSARTWSSLRSWFGSRREPAAASRNPAPARPRIAARDSTRSEPATSNEECQVWFFDEHGRRQSWIMKCDDARRYAARGGSAVMIKTGTATERRGRGSNETRQ